VRAGVDRTLDPATHARMIACLDERRDEVADIVDILRDADRQTILIAVQSVAQLPSPATCSDERRLAHQVIEAEADDAEAAAVRRILTHVSALELAGRYDAAATDAAEAEARAEALGQPLLIARARLRAGNIAARRGDFAGAASELEAAFYAAGELGADDVAAEAAWSLVNVVGYRLAKLDAGLTWARLSEMALRRAGAGEDDLRFAIVDNAVGPVHGIRGEYDAALTRFERAVRIWEGQFGPEHPRVGVLHNNIGVVHKSRGDLAATLTHQKRALEVLSAAYGPEHPEIATLLGNLGNVEVALGQPREALALYQRALTIHENALGAEHPDLARTLTGLASVERGLGEHAAALGHFQRALAIFEKTLGPEHIDVATALLDLADLQADRGARDEAETMLNRALAIREKHLGGEHPALVPVLVALGKHALAGPDPAAAVAPLERALALAKLHDAGPADLAEVEFVLADALWAGAKDRERALALARAARDAYAAAGGHAPNKLESMDDWLAAHR
jgi:tetratricopeptide (TPR) repeat protein